MTDLLPIPSNEVARMWPFAEQDIDRAIEVAGNRYEKVEIRRDLESGNRQLWLIAWKDKIIGAVVTKIFKIGICQIELCGGHGILKCLHHLKEIEQFARDNGCEETEIIGRLGWQKLLPDYELKAVILRKKL